MGLAYKMVSITIKTPGQIRSILETEGKQGWDVHGAGSSFLFLAKEDGRPREHQMTSILLRTPTAIFEKVLEEAAAGWRLAALGTNFAFFSRIPGDSVPAPSYRLEKISLMTPGGILSLANGVGAEGWQLRGMGAAVAIFAREAGGPPPVTHLLEGTLLKTPGRMQATLESRATEGFRLACVTRTFLAFVGPKPGGAA